MKHYLLILALLLPLFASAQQQDAPPLPQGELRYTLRDGWVCQNGDTLTEQQYITLTANYCIEANRQYLSARTLATSGKWIMASGVPCAVLGIAFLIYRHQDTRIAAFTLTGIGGALLATGIPLYAVGVTRKKQSVATFNLCANPDGLALAIRF